MNLANSSMGWSMPDVKAPKTVAAVKANATRKKKQIKTARLAGEKQAAKEVGIELPSSYEAKRFSKVKTKAEAKHRVKATPLLRDHVKSASLGDIALPLAAALAASVLSDRANDAVYAGTGSALGSVAGGLINDPYGKVVGGLAGAGLGLLANPTTKIAVAPLLLPALGAGAMAVGRAALPWLAKNVASGFARRAAGGMAMNGAIGAMTAPKGQRMKGLASGALTGAAYGAFKPSGWGNAANMALGMGAGSLIPGGG